MPVCKCSNYRNSKGKRKFAYTYYGSVFISSIHTWKFPSIQCPTPTFSKWSQDKSRCYICKHSLEIRGLSSTKYSSKTLQNLLCLFIHIFQQVLKRFIKTFHWLSTYLQFMKSVKWALALCYFFKSSEKGLCSFHVCHMHIMLLKLYCMDLVFTSLLYSSLNTMYTPQEFCKMFFVCLAFSSSRPGDLNYIAVIYKCSII